MEIRYFTKNDFPIYTTWFEDDQLNKALGPIDEAWLNYVLAESPPSQFSCSIEGTIVAVVGIARPTESNANYVITDIAVDPERKRTGLASRALLSVIEETDPNASWTAYVERPNETAFRFFESLDWIPTIPAEKNEMIQFDRKPPLDRIDQQIEQSEK